MISCFRGVGAQSAGIVVNDSNPFEVVEAAGVSRSHTEDGSREDLGRAHQFERVSIRVVLVGRGFDA